MNKRLAQSSLRILVHPQDELVGVKKDVGYAQTGMSVPPGAQAFLPVHSMKPDAPLPARLAGSRGWQAKHWPQAMQPSALNLGSPREAVSTS